MINNRQNGRRRGRGGGPRTPNNAPGPGNRQDNRSRGNASQLHEKYKALARDTQLAGDRVQTEYYLQFADHYFRVLNENRPRFEEQRPRRDDFNAYDEDDQDEQASAAEGEEQEDRSERDQRPERAPRRERQAREPRGERDDRPDRASREERAERAPREDRPERASRDERPEAAPRDESEQRPVGELRPRRTRARRDRDEGEDQGDKRISLDVLPPAIAPVAEAVEAPKPRRRTRRPAAEGSEEIAPAA